ncbi:MAG: hypothetical protein RQ723_04670 [Desulfuromonadales bacterium]|nr:hypothetical protein [Desulfuromonadales bacterium]
MQLKEYFEQTEGFGVMSIADSEGRVDAAIYARLHVMDDSSIALHHARSTDSGFGAATRC